MTWECCRERERLHTQQSGLWGLRIDPICRDVSPRKRSENRDLVQDVQGSAVRMNCKRNGFFGRNEMQQLPLRAARRKHVQAACVAPSRNISEARRSKRRRQGICYFGAENR